MEHWVSPREMVNALWKAGLTYRRVARESGLTPAAVIRIANGTCRAPRESTEQALRTLYDIYVCKTYKN